MGRIFQSLLLLAPLPLLADPASGYGVRLNLQSPFVQETGVGTIVTATFIVTNTLEQQENFLIDLELPEGWVTLPFEEPFFTLQPQETKVQILAFRVPPSARAGQYEIVYKVRGKEHPSISSEQKFFVEVLSKSETQSFIESAPKTTIAGKSYTVTLKTLNSGNIAIPVTVHFTSPEDSICFSSSPLNFTLEPGEARLSAFEITPSKDLQEPTTHFFHLDVESNGSISYLSSQIDVFPIKNTKTDCYRYLPMKTIFGYGMKNSEKQLFVEQYGAGSLDESKKKTSIFSFGHLRSAKRMSIAI